MSYLLLLLCLAALSTALWRAKTDKNRHSLWVLIATVAYSLVFTMGFLRYKGVLPPVTDPRFSQSSSYLSSQSITAVGVALAALHAFVAWAIWKRIPLRRFAAIVVGVYLLVGLSLPIIKQIVPVYTLNVYSGLMAPIYTLFGLCCATMAVTGWALGLTYSEFCVLGNNWLQMGIVTASALWVLWRAWAALREHSCPINVANTAAGIVLGVCYCGLFASMAHHYPMSLDAAFTACVADLQALATAWHTNYYVINIVIYIIAFLAALCANVFTAKLLRHPKTREWALALMLLHLACFVTVWLCWRSV